VRKLTIRQRTSDATLNLILDTLENKKQALVFVNSRPSAERMAEETSKKIKLTSKSLDKIALDALQALSKPTKQCERLSRCLKKGIAFHHSGLVSSQRKIIEDNFRKGNIKIICCTPTLAAGVDLPAYRTIIRDLKRYSKGSMNWIYVLEYLQMAGRAGRPSFDKEGQSIIVSASQGDRKTVINRYINGEPEEIFSKLAVEPVLRIYVLSILASGLAANERGLLDFFGRTFWAYQFRDDAQLKEIISKITSLLEEWEFITGTKEEFANADEINGNARLSTTLLGRRVSELYIDPLTAHKLIEGVKKNSGSLKSFALLQLISYTEEMRPLLTVKVREYDDIQDALMKQSDKLLTEEPSMYEEDYEDFLNSIKTALFFTSWANETDEALLLDLFQIRPGEIRSKLEKAEWLLYSVQELTRILSFHTLRKDINRVRMRLRHGVKEELLTLVRLKNIGRVRARKMFNHGIKDISGIKKMPEEKLAVILGAKIAKDLKKQIGQERKDTQEKIQPLDSEGV